MVDDTTIPLRRIIERHGLWAKKALGQNFILDRNLLEKIAQIPGDLRNACVYEVGPGPGGLTHASLKLGAAHIVVVEKDPRCVEALRELSHAHPQRLHVIEADALALDEPSVLAGAHGRPVHVLANLPYNVGTALIIRWLTSDAWPPWWASLTLMFQKEVAERITAKVGEPGYGRLAVLAQWRAHARIALRVPASAFTPPPKVMSAVVHVTPKAAVMAVPLQALETVTAAAFNQRRKMLRSALRGLDKDNMGKNCMSSGAMALIEAAGLNPEQRAETVTIEGFCRLAQAYHARNPKL
jgi:16S rRNA (adenine1518-N6/adenine1519-N6)-dimethyltransferase